jgi:hypothetical protein
MRILGGLGLALLLASGCGDLGSRAEARIASQVCDELCGWPDECFAQLGAPLEGADCVQTCEAQAELVGIACISAINSTISCLGTCDVESLTLEQQIACADEAEAISAACE